jgi:Tfp pilus assembly protein PilF
MFRPHLPAKLIRKCSKLGGAAVFVCAIFLACQAQGGGGVDSSGSGGIDSINGRIYFPSGRRSDAQIKVSLESSNAGTRVVFVDHNGSFSFRNLEPGRYTVIVDSGKEYETLSESVYIDDMRSSVTGGPGPPPRVYNLPIYLQPKRVSDPAIGSGIIDARLAEVPAPARTLYQKALESEKNGDINKAIEELNQAVSLYPAFVLALNELGVQYLKLAKLDKAVESLAAAIKLAPEEFGPRLNYGIALLNQRKLDEAETQLRTALKMKDSVPTAHMYLGIALGAQRKLAEAEKELLIAVSSKSAETARAHRYLGGVYLEMHDYKRAAGELEIYLKLMPNTRDAEQTRATIKECRRKS